MTRYLATCLLAMVFTLSAIAQDCNNPTQVCGETTVADSVESAFPVNFSCFDAQFVTFFQFNTNNNVSNTGNVTLNISGVDCATGGNLDSLFTVIVEVPAGGDPCNPATYVPVSPCVIDSLDFFIDSDDLSANAQYMVLVGTNHDPANGDCNFEIGLNGPAVDINGCCDQDISLGQSAEITATGADAIPGYTWSPSTTLDTGIGDIVVAIPSETTEYTVTGFIGDCEVTDIVTILVGPPVGIPNTITPNGDDVNDLWKISGISEFPLADVTVFDRWGQVVFRDNGGYVEPWDGTNKGRKLPTAAYYYVIQLNSTDVSIPPITGTITLIH